VALPWVPGWVDGPATGVAVLRRPGIGMVVMGIMYGGAAEREVELIL